MQSDLKFWLAFSEIKTLNPKRFHQLIAHFDTLEQAWTATAVQIAKSGIAEKAAQEIVLRRSQIDPDAMITKLVQHRVQAVTINDDTYPRLLKHIHEPPPVLYFKGTLKQDEHLLAIVGSRKMSLYGKQTTRSLTKTLCQHGITIVSGLALGVDAEAHTACVENNQRTIAVLGSGLDTQNIYPSHNRYLAEQIVKNKGCLFSEYPIGTPPLKHHFPARNRIIAGISHGTLVTEAAERSGALITAFQALEQNREVFAVPGTIQAPTSKGCNMLIKKGAHVVTQAADVLDGMNITSPAKNTVTQLSLPAQEQAIINALSDKPLTVSELAQELTLATKTITATLSSLEIKNLVRHAGGGKYIHTN